MKQNLMIISVMICLLFLVQVEAIERKNKALKTKSTTKAQKSKVTLMSRLMSKVKYDFLNDQRVFVTVQGKQTFEFNAKIKDVFINTPTKSPVGMGFTGFEQLSGVGDDDFIDQTGFTSYCLKQVAINGQFTETPTVDYRYVKDCLFTNQKQNGLQNPQATDASTSFITFSALANEKFDANTAEFGSPDWKISLKLEKFTDQQATQLLTDLTNNCKARNQIVNNLKASATKLGNDYNTLFTNFANKQMTLADLEKAKASEESLKQQVAATAATEAANLVAQAAAMKANQDAITKLNADLQAQSALKLTSAAELKSAQDNLATYKNNLQILKQQSITQDGLLNTAQKNLNDATDFDKSKQAKLSNVQQQAIDAKKAQDQAAANAADAAAKLKAQQEAQALIAANQAKALAALQQEQAALGSALSANAKILGESKLKVQSYTDQQKQTKDQVLQLTNLINKLSDQIQQKTNVKQMAENEAARLKKETEIQEQLACKAQDDMKANLAKLLQQEQAQQKLLNQQTQQTAQLQQKSQVDSTQVQASLAAYANALKLIKGTSVETSQYCISALRQVNNNKHAVEISKVISQTLGQIKGAMFRQAQQYKFYKRLAKQRKNASKKVRLQRKQLKHRLIRKY